MSRATRRDRDTNTEEAAAIDVFFFHSLGYEEDSADAEQQVLQQVQPQQQRTSLSESCRSLLRAR